MDIKFGTETPCKNWLQSYTFSLAIIYGMSIGISLINAVLTEVLKFLSMCERPHTRTEELLSASSKTWMVVFVNTGLVILLINANYIRLPLPEKFPVFKGPY
jgi:hypothetical protein